MDDIEEEAALRELEEKEKKKREKLLIEQRKKEFHIEETRLKNDVYSYITKLIREASEDDASHLKFLRKQVSPTATEHDRIYKMQQWIKLSNLDISLDDEEATIYFKGSDVEKGNVVTCIAYAPCIDLIHCSSPFSPLQTNVKQLSHDCHEISY